MDHYYTVVVSFTTTRPPWLKLCYIGLMSDTDKKPRGSPPDPKDDPIVDLSLLEETLRMTVEERLALNDRMIRTILELRRGFGQD